MKSIKVEKSGAFNLKPLKLQSNNNDHIILFFLWFDIVITGWANEIFKNFL